MNNRKNNYVVSYHVQKYRFGNDINRLLEYAEKHGIYGTYVMHRILDDGSWSRTDLRPKKGGNDEAV